jgi:hypothetical protein
VICWRQAAVAGSSFDRASPRPPSAQSKASKLVAVLVEFELAQFESRNRLRLGTNEARSRSGHGFRGRSQSGSYRKGDASQTPNSFSVHVFLTALAATGSEGVKLEDI